MTKEIKGKLVRNDINRYEIEQEDGYPYELRSGDAFELYLGGHWVRTNMEHSDRIGGYYAAGLEGISLLGKLARVRLSY